MFISHAQNFEDVILMRAFKDVQKGFYIDVGAQDPVADSVSLAFYNNGWRGIHVEPNPFYAAKLRSARPDEEVVEAVVGAGSGDSVFYIVGETGLSTGRSDIARTYDKSDVQEINVPIISLARILNGVNRDVHWLKIDVEGMEGSVLESWNGSDIRPWIVVIESTLPNSQIPAHEAWEGMLLSRGYLPVYFDGINKFYVHERRADLRSIFGPGPNCFDEFKLDASSGYVDVSHLAEAQQEHRDAIKRIESRIKELDATRESEFKSYATAFAVLETKLAEAQSARLASDTRVSELVTAHSEAANAHAAAMTALEVAKQDCKSQRIYIAELDERIRTDQDNWNRTLAATELALSQAKEAERSRIIELQVVTDNYEKRLYDLWVESVGLRNQISALEDSVSWRITRPIRVVSMLSRRVVRSLESGGVVGRALLRVAAGNPRLRRVTTKVLRRLPIIDRFARSQMTRALGLAAGRQSASPDRQLGGGASFVQQNPPIISPRAQAILSCFESEYANKGDRD